MQCACAVCAHITVDQSRLGSTFTDFFWFYHLQKLRQIEDLKQRQEEGQTLEQNQVHLLKQFGPTVNLLLTGHSVAVQLALCVWCTG